MRLGGGGLDPSRFTTALSADFSFSCDYAFLWLYIKHYLAESVHVATGKQETVKEAQVCNESMKT